MNQVLVFVSYNLDNSQKPSEQMSCLSNPDNSHQYWSNLLAKSLWIKPVINSPRDISPTDPSPTVNWYQSSHISLCCHVANQSTLSQKVTISPLKSLSNSHPHLKTSLPVGTYAYVPNSLVSFCFLASSVEVVWVEPVTLNLTVKHSG